MSRCHAAKAGNVCYRGFLVLVDKLDHHGTFGLRHHVHYRAVVL